MKRTCIRPRSTKTEAWAKLYLSEKMGRIGDGQDCCQHCKTICGILDGHHYAGSRRNENILRFVILGRGCHDRTNHTLRSLGLLAEVNGSFAVPHPAVERAEARFKELMSQVEG